MGTSALVSAVTALPWDQGDDSSSENDGDDDYDSDNSDHNDDNDRTPWQQDMTRSAYIQPPATRPRRGCSD